MKPVSNGMRTVTRGVDKILCSGSVLLVGLLAGCLDPGGAGSPNVSRWSALSLPDAPRAAAFDAGVHAMRQWFTVAEASPAKGLIRGASKEYEQEGGTGRFRDAAVGYRNHLRRSATLLIRERSSGCVASCEVRVQRLDTADHRLFHQNRQFSDVPSDTPIDRDAGISPQQAQVWTDLPRDRKLERQILDVLRRRVLGENAG